MFLIIYHSGNASEYSRACLFISVHKNSHTHTCVIVFVCVIDVNVCNWCKYTRVCTKHAHAWCVCTFVCMQFKCTHTHTHTHHKYKQSCIAGNACGWSRAACYSWRERCSTAGPTWPKQPRFSASAANALLRRATRYYGIWNLIWYNAVSMQHAGLSKEESWGGYKDAMRRQNRCNTGYVIIWYAMT